MTTTRKLGWTIRAIDTTGALLLGGCIAAFVWLLFIHGDRYANEVTQLTRTRMDAKQGRIAMAAACDTQHDRLERSRRELSATGQLPDHPPVETYFQHLSQLATQFGLKVYRHHPLASRQYPGLVEHRFAYELGGGYRNLTQFLKAVEQTEFWGDVSYLKLERRSPRPSTEGNARFASLTISLFSAPPPKPQHRGDT